MVGNLVTGFHTDVCRLTPATPPSAPAATPSLGHPGAVWLHRMQAGSRDAATQPRQVAVSSIPNSIVLRPPCRNSLRSVRPTSLRHLTPGTHHLTSGTRRDTSARGHSRMCRRIGRGRSRDEVVVRDHIWIATTIPRRCVHDICMAAQAPWRGALPSPYERSVAHGGGRGARRAAQRRPWRRRAAACSAAAAQAAARAAKRAGGERTAMAEQAAHGTFGYRREQMPRRRRPSHTRNKIDGIHDEGISRAVIRNVRERYKGGTTKRGIYFGACSFCHENNATFLFKECRRLQWIAGYDEDVDWIDSSALDLCFLRHLLFPTPGSGNAMPHTERAKLGYAAKRIFQDMGPLACRLGFHVFVRKMGPSGGFIDLRDQHID